MQKVWVLCAMWAGRSGAEYIQYNLSGKFPLSLYIPHDEYRHEVPTRLYRYDLKGGLIESSLFRGEGWEPKGSKRETVTSLL
jgi:hypothetical protein